MSELNQEGLRYLLESAISDVQTPPANFYLGLATDVSIAEAEGLADIVEVTGTGYARVAIASAAAAWTSATAGTADWKVTAAAACVFTAGASDWDDATMWFLATSADGSGKLIASGALSETRSLLNGDTLSVTPTIQLNG